jgi:hypothetical protein
MTARDPSDRNAEIVRLYQAGSTIPILARQFRVSRALVYHILQEAEVWKPIIVTRVRGEPHETITAHVPRVIKEQVVTEAEKTGTSISQWSARQLADALHRLGYSNDE